MGYYISAKLTGIFDHAITRTEAALAAEGFGIISRIDMQQTLKAKIGVEFRPYVILGACNPSLAHEALQLEDKVGLMLPCNIIVQQMAGGDIEVAGIDPVASMEAIGNADLATVASDVRDRLHRAIGTLQAGPK
ncbi:MAG: DUF302 domain-containing protein [Porphyrobacter sp.]|jgi:uncharacterized protein (DUF302 family)|nr:DUF302 domain-containing protein [Porphyrobacter sp.]